MNRSIVVLAAVAAWWAMPHAPALAQGAAPNATGCPASGCKIPGITVPNEQVLCKEAGANVHDDGKFNPKTTLCNTGPIDPATWIYGPRHDLTPEQQAAPHYNQVKARMVKGLPVIGTRWGAPDGSDYCNVTRYDEAKNHFTWADEAHAALDNSTLYAKWQNYCPGMNYDTTAARGALGS